MKIIKARETDLQTILDLQYTAYQSEAKLFNSQDIPPLKQTIEEVCDEFRKGIILKAVYNNIIVGSVRAYSENGTAYIGKLMVHPEYQGNGIGTKLLCEIEKYYPNERYELFTSTRSINNIKMYEKLGYHKFKEKMINDKLCLVYLEKI